MLLNIRPLHKEDYEAVRSIYLEGIATGVATFETKAPDWDTFNKKYHLHSRFVILSNPKTIIGWASISPVSRREVYRGVAEVSIYIKAIARGQGAGSYLLEKLIESSEQNGIWTLQASIFPENIASLQTHKKNGFRLIGYRERIAKLQNTWRDNVLLERRSKQF